MTKETPGEGTKTTIKEGIFGGMFLIIPCILIGFWLYDAYLAKSSVGQKESVYRLSLYKANGRE